MLGGGARLKRWAAAKYDRRGKHIGRSFATVMQEYRFYDSHGGVAYSAYRGALMTIVYPLLKRFEGT